jgi:hypothetical protein
MHKLKLYLDAVEDAFGADIDHALLQKIYSAHARMNSTGIPQLPASAASCQWQPPDQHHVSIVCRSTKSRHAAGHAPIQLTAGFPSVFQ